MPINDGQMSVLRSYVGGSVTDDVLEERYARTGSFDEVILETLRARLAVMTVDEPGVFVVDGLTINQTDNIRTLRSAIKDFENSNGSGLDTTASTAVGGFGTTTVMHREDRSR